MAPSGRVYVLEDARGSRRVGEEAFPLAVGGPRADLRVTSSEEPLAWLGISDGELFLQPVAGPRRVLLDGAPLGTSHWLRDGDVLELDGGRLGVEITAETTRLRVLDEASGGYNEPPELVPPPRRDEERAGEGSVLTVRPIDFRPSPALAAPRRRVRPRPAVLLGILMLAALVAAAGFLFTARAVEVVVEPPPRRLAFEGGPLAGWLQLELGGRHLLRPGEYTLVAQRPGYRRLETPVTVTDEPHQTLRFELERLPGRLGISTRPAVGVEVWIDGERVGTTPLGAVELAAGEHEVRLRAPLYEDFVTRLALEGGGAAQQLEAELIPASVPVSFASRPEGARVLVDGHEVGRTPVTAEVASGDHSFELLLGGYKPHRGRLEIAAGQPLTVPPVTLSPSDGNLVVASEPAGAAVTVDGVYRGETPLDLALEPGRGVRVRLSKAGYTAREETVTLASGATREIHLVLPAEEGEVEVTTWPPDAEVLAGGELRRRGSGTLVLPAVAQEIIVRKEGFEPFRATVTPLPGVRQTLDARLVRQGEARAEPRSAAAPVVRTSEGQELRRIEPGRFRMGASRREPGRRSNEVEREVELTRPVYLAVHTVTNRQFRRFQEDHLSGQVGGESLEIDHHPVVRVTWEEAAQYCNWLSEKEGLPPAYVQRDGRWVAVRPLTAGYRLPTEAEWAWAARFPGGAVRKYPWGNDLPVPAGAGNWADAAAAALVQVVLPGYRDGFATTAPGDRFPPSPLGLYDLGSNVAEWVNDVYAIHPPGSGEVERDPLGPAEGDLHVIRGASWIDGHLTRLRLTYRDYGVEPRPDVGFRIARTAE